MALDGAMARRSNRAGMRGRAVVAIVGSGMPRGLAGLCLILAAASPARAQDAAAPRLPNGPGQVVAVLSRRRTRGVDRRRAGDGARSARTQPRCRRKQGVLRQVFGVGSVGAQGARGRARGGMGGGLLVVPWMESGLSCCLRQQPSAAHHRARRASSYREPLASRLQVDTSLRRAMYPASSASASRSRPAATSTARPVPSHRKEPQVMA